MVLFYLSPFMDFTHFWIHGQRGAENTAAASACCPHTAGSSP